MGGLWAHQQCTVGVLVSQSHVKAVTEMVKRFLNVRLNPRADVLDLIECGTCDSTYRTGGHQLSFYSHNLLPGTKISKPPPQCLSCRTAPYHEIAAF